MKLVKNMIKFKFPTEIINKILTYIGELNNNVLITQYSPISNKEFYKINKHSDLLYNINALILTKRLYPLYDNPGSIMIHKEMYKYACCHYKKILKNNTTF